MNPVRGAAWLLLTTLLGTPLASAAPKAKARTASRSEASLAASSERVQAAALRDALQRHVAEAGLSESLAVYTLSPSVVQLRRYVEASRLTLVCVVDLSLRDRQGALLASVRGSATGTSSQNEAIDRATHAAVSRLPQALQALRSDAPSPQMAEARRQWEVPLR